MLGNSGLAGMVRLAILDVKRNTNEDFYYNISNTYLCPKITFLVTKNN